MFEFPTKLLPGKKEKRDTASREKRQEKWKKDSIVKASRMTQPICGAYARQIANTAASSEEGYEKKQRVSNKN